MGNFKVPYDRSGNMLYYAYPTGYNAVHEWRENEPFAATLMIVNHHRGRSATYLTWQTAESVTYPMFMIDFIDLMLTTTIRMGRIQGKFIACKRGSYYGLKWHSEI